MPSSRVKTKSVGSTVDARKNQLKVTGMLSRSASPLGQELELLVPHAALRMRAFSAGARAAEAAPEDIESTLVRPRSKAATSATDRVRSIGSLCGFGDHGEAPSTLNPVCQGFTALNREGTQGPRACVDSRAKTLFYSLSE